ncbi:MAG: thiamine diphosphokinase [Lysinibacillus sp.]|nr:thiamine diphosphokinase [Lysinibacillus sp.]
MKRILICAGGPKYELCSFESFKNEKDTYYIGADRGALYLLDEGIIPNEVIGDFDSLTDKEWKLIHSKVKQIEKYKPEKDETDTDLALLKAVSYNPKEIFITGVTGGRLDHFEAAIRSIYQMKSQYPHIEHKIINSHNEISILLPGKHMIYRDEKYRYLSFFSFEQAMENVTLRGVKYETTSEKIDAGTSRFTSNELVSDEGYISFSSGICLMIRSSDL